jgi:hypothetical protein
MSINETCSLSKASFLIITLPKQLQIFGSNLSVSLITFPPSDHEDRMTNDRSRSEHYMKGFILLNMYGKETLRFN